MKHRRTVTGRMSMRQTQTPPLADGVPYTFYTDVVVRMLDSAGIIHLVVAATPDHAYRRRTVCTSTRWESVEPTTVIWDEREMVTCLACLGGFRG